jgi:aspartate aminotransferase
MLKILLLQQVDQKLYFCNGSTMDPDEIIPEPFYANYNGFSAASGVNVVSVISIDTGFALPAIADFENLLRQTKAILICNPGNPTGYLYSKKK